jgi:hypothetical protein
MLARSKSYPTELGSPSPAVGTDAAAHGTGVAGVALYGDIASCADRKQFEPAAWLINARLLDDNNKLHPDHMPFVRGIVEDVGSTSRIFNLSLGLDSATDMISTYAADIDALARERNAIFIISSGNAHPGTLFTDPGEAKQRYPEYLLTADYRVLQPAESLNALTVGSISTSRDPHPLSTPIEPFAGKRSPSPFSRRGGLANVVKPELVEEGGDLALLRTATTTTWAQSPGLSIPTTGPNFSRGKLFTYAEGTSLAAPKVAHMAARILTVRPDATANLVRALLVASASLPAGAQGLPGLKAMALCGFGVPDLGRATYCTDHRVTLFSEGEIAMDQVLIFDVPIPTELQSSRGKKRLTVAIAYDPPVSPLEQIRPAGISLTWKVARPDADDATLLKAIASDAEADVGETPAPNARKTKAVFQIGTLPKRPQQRGTVQKDIFEWSRPPGGDSWKLALTAKATRLAHAQERQRYAIVVTIEHTSGQVEIYQSVRARAAHARVRLRVPA